MLQRLYNKYTNLLFFKKKKTSQNFTEHYKLYKTEHIVQLFFSKKLYKTLQTVQKLFNTFQNSTQSYTTLRNSTKLETSKHTQLFNVLHNFTICLHETFFAYKSFTQDLTRLYKAIHNCTDFYKTSQDSTKLYRIIPNYTRLCTSRRNYTQLYISVHNYTQLDEIIYNFYTRKQ